MSDNLKAMQECGLLPEGEIPTNPVEMFVDHQELKERLEEYTSRSLASQQAAHEAEIARLKEEVEKERKQLEPLRAQVAMLREESKRLRSGLADIANMTENNKIILAAADLIADTHAISNTQATAEQFIAECDMTNTGYIHKSAIARRATSKKAG